MRCLQTNHFLQINTTQTIKYIQYILLSRWQSTLALITSTLWNVNVWCGIIENRAIILGGNLNGQKYANFLRDKLQILLDKFHWATVLQCGYNRIVVQYITVLIAMCLTECFPICVVDEFIGRLGHQTLRYLTFFYKDI